MSMSDIADIEIDVDAHLCTLYTIEHLHANKAWARMFCIGFPFFVKKLFTRNIVSDITDGYYVGIIAVVTT
jgi:hypothetical protein